MNSYPIHSPLPEVDNPAHGAQPSTVAVMILFGSVVFATIGLGAKTWLVGDNRALSLAMNSRNQQLRWTFLSIYSLLYQLSFLGLILLMTYLMEHHPIFPHTELNAFDSDELIYFIALIIFVSSYTIKRNDGKPLSLSPEDEAAARKAKEKGASADGTKTSDNPNAVNIDDASSIATPDAKRLEDILLNDDDDDDDDDDILPLRKRRNSNNGEGVSVVVGDDDNSIDDIGMGDNNNNNNNNNMSFSKKSSNNSSMEIRAVNPITDILNSSQTLEWKGWIFIIFLAYRYANAFPLRSLSMDSDDLITNNGVPFTYGNMSRVGHSMYLFMTGYIHFGNFYNRNDYGLPRVLRTLFRLNFFCFFLCLMHNNPYIFYYVCPMHSYFYLMCYTTMKMYREVNYDKMKLRLKLLCLAAFVFLLWDVATPLFQILHLPFFVTVPPKEGAPLGPMWEWYFRTTVDHWSAFLGILFASNQPITSLILRKVESFGGRKEIYVKLVIGTGITLGLLTWWNVCSSNHSNPRSYASLHPYFSALPVLAYVYVRNVRTDWRDKYIGLFHFMGQFALEAYLLQHHLLFSGNGRKMLTLLPGWPKVNLGLCLLLYLYLSRRVYILTQSLRNTLLPLNDERLCGRTVGVLAIFVSSFYAASMSLSNFGLLSLGSIAVMIIVAGILIYQTILDMTWRRYIEAKRHWKRNMLDQQRRQLDQTTNYDDDQNSYNDDSDHDHDNDEEDDTETAVGKISPPIIATCVIFILGLIWHTMALTGAGKIQPLPSNCAMYANDGKWIDIPLCSSFHRGSIYRYHHLMGGFAQTCGSTTTPTHDHLVWGWYDNPPNTLCRFSPRSSTNTLPSLHSRNIIFVGDGMIKSLFHSFCRVLLDDDKAGEYDATVPKHSDITKYFDTVKLTYKWAPLAIDQLENIKDLRDYREDGGADLVIVGGGAWDRLHVWATDEDQDSLKATVVKLAKEMETLKRSGVPIVWMIPTTINTKALNQEEKRNQMNEGAVQQMRDLYATLGVLGASTFVLDGRVFTNQRVEESYDGMHYPPEIYDAGVQILANALDWIFPQPRMVPGSEKLIYGGIPPQPGMLANTSLGLMMLCFIFIGLFFFDGYLGFSYLGAMVVPNIMPNDLYEEAFYPVHSRWKLPMGSFWMQERGEDLGLMSAAGGAGGSGGKDDIFHGAHDLELTEERRSR